MHASTILPETDTSVDQRQLSFDSFLTWFQELERDAEDYGVRSRQYSDDWLSCYTRSSRFCSGAIGRQVVDFASIDVKSDRRGDKYLTLLLRYLEANQSRLKATHFYFENVANLRLAGWLERQGFEVVNGEQGSIASYCRQILPTDTAGRSGQESVAPNKNPAMLRGGVGLRG